MTRPLNPSEDRRKHKRTPATFIVTYRLRSPVQVAVHTDEREYAAVALDISAGGLGLDLGHALPAGVHVRLNFTLTAVLPKTRQEMSRQFDLSGKVLYCVATSKDAHRGGILFENVSLEDQTYLQHYVEEQSLKAQWL